MKADLILIHAPSVYDFRKKTIMFGPMSDLVPSTPIFEMYPIGFLTMANYLERRGYRVRICNLAYLMHQDSSFDAEKYISRLEARSFGIDLHWLPHCQGSIEVAKIIKRYHPRTPVIFGGFSASFFYKELILLDQVDYVIRGDSTEEPMYRLVGAIKGPDTRRLSDVPNLVYKKGGKVYENPLDCISTDLEEIDFDYRIMFKQVLRFRDLKSTIPFAGWLRYPITTIPIVRGCPLECSGCGGSKSAFDLFGCRKKPAYRSPKKLVEEIGNINRYINAPIFILGDINSNGQDYVKEFFGYARGLPSGIQIFFEFFSPPQRWFFDTASDIFSNVLYEISPDSHDPKIRKKMGKCDFSNQELVEGIGYALKKGAVRFDTYFMTGLPGQDKDSVLDTVSFCQKTYERLNWDKRFMPFISPMAPFIDPGSRAFCNPEKFGYKLTRKTLSEHIQAITQPSWKYILNYESTSLSRHDLVDSTYQAALGLNSLKKQAGSISGQVADKNQDRIENALKTMKKIDSIMQIEDIDERRAKLKKLKEDTDRYSMSTVCEKKELEFPLFNRRFNWFNILTEAVFGRKR